MQLQRCYLYCFGLFVSLTTGLLDADLIAHKPKQTSAAVRFSDLFDVTQKHALKKVSYSSLYTSTADGIILPRKAADYATVLEELWDIREQSGASYTLTFYASGTSFGQQALPPEKTAREKTRIMLDTRNLNSFELLSEEPDKIIVKVGGGLTWGNVHRNVKKTINRDTIPFDVPSSEHITVGGALASNTFSRTSHTGGHFSSGHVTEFDLLKPDGSRITCSRNAPPDSLNRQCFFAVPGAMGALGLIETVTVELYPIDESRVVHTEVLRTLESSGSFAAEHKALTNYNQATRTYDQGLYSLIQGNPKRPYVMVIGSSSGRVRGKDKEGRFVYEDGRFDDSPSLSIYDEDNAWKARLISLGHLMTFTGIPDYLIRRKLTEKARFTNDIYNFTYYHNGYWEAHGGKAVRDFPSAHQAWAVPNRHLEDFMNLAGDIIDNSCSYRWLVYSNLLLQDVTPVPSSEMIMSPFDGDDYQVYQITVSVGSWTNMASNAATSFFEELSEQAYEKYGIRVHLLKETHVSDQVLQHQYQKNIKRLRPIRDKLDPLRIIDSALWQRLDPEVFPDIKSIENL